MDKKIIEKIQKLLALSGSSNIHEAEAAMNKAQELMATHNIEMQQIDNHDAEYINEKTDTYKRESVEAKYVNNILTKYFFVRVVISRTYDNKKYLNIVGEKNNVKTALHMKTYLTNVFKVLWREYKKEHNAPNSSKQSFYMGLLSGFSVKMDEQRKETEMKYDMVLVDDPKVDAKVKDLFPRLRSGSARSINSYDSKAKNAGHTQGKSLNNNSGSIAS